MFEIKKDPKHVIICGTGSGWEAIPRQTSATIYALNDFVHTEKYGLMPDLLFIMDILDEKPQVVAHDNLGEIISRINKLNVPLIGPYRYAEIPKSQAFPLKECVRQFGLPYFSNTICYMIAYALMNNVTTIEIFGVNQGSSHEYSEEKGGVEYWLGIATGRGVTVTMNGKHSQLMRFKGRFGGDALYGYLMPYREIVRAEEQWGEQVVKRLLPPTKNPNNHARKIK